MRHLFFTRIAVDISEISAAYSAKSFQDLRPNIELWLNKSKQFYEHQTIDRPIKVFLRYSPRYEAMLNEYEWPDYVQFTTEYPNQSAFREIQPGEKVSLTRIDADDSFSIDFLEMIEQLEREQTENRTLVIHKRIRQQLTETGDITKPMKHRSPGCSSIIFSSVPDDIEPGTHIRGKGKSSQFIGIVGNHSKYQYEPHITSPGCYVLMRVTGHNSFSRLGFMNKETNFIPWEWRPITRFVGI